MGRMMLLGDSITAWNPRRDAVNHGVPGDTTRDILWRLADIQGEEGSRVVLMGGINDILMNFPLEKILRNIEEIIVIFKKRRFNPEIISILPVAGDSRRNERVIEVNRGIESIARRMGVPYIDVYDDFLDGHRGLKGEFTTDGIHLSTSGYRVLNSIIDNKK